MITNWWPANLTVGAGPAQGTHTVYPQPLSTTAKVCQVSKFLYTLLWASLVYGAGGQLTDPFPSQFELLSLDGTNGFIIHGEAANDQSGFSVSSAGDVNGDGLSDLLIGAYNASPSGGTTAGKSYVVFGSRSVVSGGVFELSSLDGTNGFILNGEAVFDWSGFSVSSAGDVNGDGLSDIVIGAPQASTGRGNGAGKSYVVFGSRRLISGGVLELSSINGTNGFIVNGEDGLDESGRSVSIAGDLNGDGLTDVLIGAPRASSGRSYVVFGSSEVISSGLFDLSNLNGTNGFSLRSKGFAAESGSSVSTAGDVNGDGLSDIIIGTEREGIANVVFGSRAIVNGGRLDLSSLSGTNGFILDGLTETLFGVISVSLAGDVNGDGLSDLVIGDSGASPSRNYAGKSYVVFGTRSVFNGGSLDLSTLNGRNGFVLNGEARNDNSGHSVSSAGDVNGDGLDDFVIGAKSASPSGRSEAGKSYVVFGSRTVYSGGSFDLSSLDGTNGFILKGDATRDYSGSSVSSAGDVNGDGISDLVIGAPNADRLGRFSIGKSYVIFGRNLTWMTQSPTPPPSTGKSSSLPNTATSSRSSSQRAKTLVTSSQKVSNPSYLTTKPGLNTAKSTQEQSASSYSMLSLSSHASKLLSSSGSLRTAISEEGNTIIPSPVKSPTLLTSASPSVLNQSLENDSTPIIAGIASFVGALVCSLFIGGIFAWRKKTTKNVEGDKTSLKNIEIPQVNEPIDLSKRIQKAGEDEMQSARYDQVQRKAQEKGTYIAVPIAKRKSNYNEWPQKPAQSDPKRYSSIVQVEKQHDAYAAAKVNKTHENYDDVPT